MIEYGRDYDDREPPPDDPAGVGVPLWDEPLPLGWRTDLPRFPTAALPPVLSRYVTAVSAEIQTPDDLAGTLVVGVVAGSIGGRVTVQIRSGWTEPVNLYMVPVADPAARKSAVVAACRVPLATAEEQLRGQLGPAVLNSRTEKEIRDQRARSLMAAAAKSGDALDIDMAQDAVRAAEQVEVRAWPRLTTADATPEAVTTLLAEQDGRIIAISAEAGVFDSLAGRYTKAANFEALLMAHAGDEIIVDRRGRAPERVQNPALTLIASIQPYALRSLVTRDDFAGRGLLARVLWSLAPDVVGTRGWEATEAPEAVKAAYRTLIVDLVTLTYDEPVILTLSPAAYKRLGVYHDRVEKLMKPGADLGAGLIRQWAGKLIGATARIAGSLHAATAAQKLLVDTEIGDDTMRSAIMLGEYFRAHAEAALSPGDDRRTANATALLGWLIRQEKARFTLREIQRTGPKPLRPVAVSRPLVDYLAELGWVRGLDDGGYHLHPDAADLLERATRATTGDGDNVSAGEGDDDVSPNLSPSGATTGDTPDDVSPPVAPGRRQQSRQSDGRSPGKTPAEVLPVAPVAPVARSCRVCRDSIDPAAGDTHPNCDPKGPTA